jgi:hypothetical protein
MWNMVQTPSRVRARDRADNPPRHKSNARSDDPLAPAKGLLAAAGLAAGIWAVIGLMVWWLVG